MWWSNGDWNSGLKVGKKNELKYRCSIGIYIYLYNIKTSDPTYGWDLLASERSDLVILKSELPDTDWTTYGSQLQWLLRISTALNWGYL